MAGLRLTEGAVAAEGESMLSPPPRNDHSIASKLDRLLGHLVEFPVAILVVAEVVILFAGIIARYVVHQPLIWSDELASILFLWLAMLGAVVAFRRGEHMRMTALVGMMNPQRRAFFDVIAIVGAMAFLLFIVYPAYDYAHEETYITTPALEITNAWRAAALPVGAGLMIVSALIKLFQVSNLRHVVTAIALIGVLTLVFWLLGPSLKPLGNINLLIFFVGVVAALVLSGVPIAFFLRSCHLRLSRFDDECADDRGHRTHG